MEYFIRKNGYLYRPGAAGYTSYPAKAGRWSEAEARRHVDPHAGVEMVPVSAIITDQHALDRLLITDAHVTLPDGRKVELPTCYVYEFERIVADALRNNYDPPQGD